MPRTMQVSIVRKSATILYPPEAPMIMEMSEEPMPVVVMTQAMMPATAQAMPTVRVLLAPDSSASKKREKSMR